MNDEHRNEAGGQPRQSVPKLRRHAIGALFLTMIVTGATGCASGEPRPPKQARRETKTEEGSQMMKSGSRIPAPAVEPVRSGGVRYEQVKNGLVAGLDQMGGYLAAYDETSGQQLWTLKVYDNRRDPEREGDVQDVFFRSMQLQADGRLLIENERGKRFIVDPQTRTVQTVA